MCVVDMPGLLVALSQKHNRRTQYVPLLLFSAGDGKEGVLEKIRMAHILYVYFYLFIILYVFKILPLWDGHMIKNTLRIGLSPSVCA